MAANVTVMGSSMRILLDMDEVLAKTVYRWVELYNEEWGDDLEFHEVKSWAVHHWVKPECGERVYEILDRPGFFCDVPVYENADLAVRNLVDAGHDVVIVTATPKSSWNAFPEKREWLKRNFPFVPEKNLISAHRKDLIVGDILCDDGLHNLVDFPGISVCMERPWNIGEPEKYDHVVRDLPGLYEFVMTDDFEDARLSSRRRGWRAR